MRGGFRGEWWTDGGGTSPGVVVLVIAVVILAGSGAATAMAAAVVTALIAAAAVVVLLVAGLTVFLVYRARHPLPGPVRHIVPAPVVHELPAPERPAVGQGPREVHQHVHLHVQPGTDLSGLGGLFNGNGVPLGRAGEDR